MRTNTRKFRLALTSLTLVALLLSVFGAVPVGAQTTFTLPGGSLTADLGPWGGTGYVYPLTFDVTASGSIDIIFYDVDGSLLQYDNESWWEDALKGSGMVGVTAGTAITSIDPPNDAVWSNMQNQNTDSSTDWNGSSVSTLGPDGTPFTSDDTRSWLFQSWYRPSTGGKTGHPGYGDPAYNSESYETPNPRFPGAPTHSPDYYCTFDLRLKITHDGGNNYTAQRWVRMHNCASFEEGHPYGCGIWNHAINNCGPDAAWRQFENGAGVYTFPMTNIDLTAVHPFVGIGNFPVPATHTLTWGNVVVIGTPTPQTEVWVDDDWAVLSPGDPADGHIFGYDAFATIQDGIDNVAGSTVHVAAGTYHEEVIVDKAVTLNGANAGTPGYGMRGAESIVDADDTDVWSDDPATWVAAFFITSGDVTIDGFKTIDADEGIHVACAYGGDSDLWGDRENVVIKNNYIDTSEGYPQTHIAATGIIYYNDANWHVTPTAYSVDGAVVQDNYIDQEHQKSSIWFQDVIGSVTIKGNKIDGNPCDNGIILGATSALGFHIDLSGTVIEDNDVEECDYGMQLKRFTTSTSPVSITDNDITGGGTGFRLWNIGSETVIQGNTITNNTKGFELGRGGGSYPVNNVRILGNDILDNDIGIRIRNGGLGTGNEAHFNNIVGNNQFGVKNEDTVVFDATNNWWGSGYGPEDATGETECLAPSEGGWNCDACDKNTAPVGLLGDKVSDNVDYCPWVLDLWVEINGELDALIEKVNDAIMPRIIQRRLVGKLEYAKELKDNAKIEYEAGNIEGAKKKLGVAKSQVESFESMVKITRRIEPEAKESFLAESAEIIDKIDELMEKIQIADK